MADGLWALEAVFIDPILTKLDIWVYINKRKVKFDNGRNPRILIRFLDSDWLMVSRHLEAVFIDRF